MKKYEYLRYKKEDIENQIYEVHCVLYKESNELRIYKPICPICKIFLWIRNIENFAWYGFKCDNGHKIKYEDIKSLKLYKIKYNEKRRD
jgi:hypothetical protein